MDISPKKLIKLAVDFYNFEPLVQRKVKQRRRGSEDKKEPRKEKMRSRSKSVEDVKQTNKKFAKFENLRPLSNFLLSTLNDHQVPHFKTKKIVGDIIERIVIAGYDWEKILSYHSKGKDHFTKKLIPYIFMSKDDLPEDLGPDVLLRKMFLNQLQEEKKGSNISKKSRTSDITHSKSSDQTETPNISSILRKRKLIDSNIDLNDDDLNAKVNNFINRKDKRRRNSSADSTEDRRVKTKITEERRSSSESSDDTKSNIDLKTEKEASPPVSDSSSTDIDQMFSKGESKEKQKQSLLEKVNEIIKSCVRLKTDKKISGMRLEKANKIIAKAEAKKIKLLNNSKQEDEDKEDDVEEDCVEVNPDEPEVKAQREVRDPEDIEEGEITDDDEEDDDEVREVPVEDKKPRSRDVSKSSVRSELQAMAGQDNRVTVMSLSRRSRRSPSWSPSHSYRKKAAAVTGSRYNHHQYRQSSRSVSSDEEVEEEELSRWIPVTPCTIQEDVEVEPMSSVMANIKAKGEFSFKDNLGCYVRITKWTGKDSVDFLTIRPQVVKIEGSLVRVEMSNTYSDKFLNIFKHDKVACMSILSYPPPSVMFSRLDCSPERYQSKDKRWFKVTTVVLHKKGDEVVVVSDDILSCSGSLDKITISPGKTLKVVGTVIGPLKKHIGRDVLVSELDVGDPVPIHSQVVLVCSAVAPCDLFPPIT